MEGKGEREVGEEERLEQKRGKGSVRREGRAKEGVGKEREG